MDCLSLDILGPLLTTSKGNTCILVIADYLTRWVKAYAFPNQTAETIAQTLVIEFLSRFECPLEIHMDQGRNFQSDLFRELCRIFDITKTKTTPLSPCIKWACRKISPDTCQNDQKLHSRQAKGLGCKPATPHSCLLKHIKHFLLKCILPPSILQIL